MNTCSYVLAWRGPCGQPATKGDRCPAHAGERCLSCGLPATRQCPDAASLVCGAPLCDACEHGAYRHQPKPGDAGQPAVDAIVARRAVPRERR